VLKKGFPKECPPVQKERKKKKRRGKINRGRGPSGKSKCIALPIPKRTKRTESSKNSRKHCNEEGMENKKVIHGRRGESYRKTLMKVGSSSQC